MELDVDSQRVKVIRFHELADRDADDLVEGDGQHRKIATLAAREDEQRRAAVAKVLAEARLGGKKP